MFPEFRYASLLAANPVGHWRLDAGLVLPAHARRRSDVCVVGQLLQHEIGDIGARSFDRPKITPDLRAVAITAARVSIRQHARRTITQSRSLAMMNSSCLNLSHM